MALTPRVSIILPTYNGERFIRRAIESVRAQSFPDWELIVINDGSTDRTGALVSEIASIDDRIRMIVLQPNRGIQKALNEGLLQAKSAYIARIDDDDTWCDREKLLKQVAYLDKNERCVLIGTGVIVKNEDGRELYRFRNPESNADVRARMLYRNCFSHSSVLFRRQIALDCGGYSEYENVKHIEDYDLWLRLGRHGEIVNLPDYSLCFTARNNAISGRHKIEQLRRQLQISSVFRSEYPRYWTSRIRGYLRLIGYTTLGMLLPETFKQRIIARYKRS